jgi:guanylate kinase
VISGPSGVGKSTLIERLTRHEKCRLAVSATTRLPRPGEIDGVHYRFMGRPEFEAMREKGLLLETAEVHGNLYGTPAAEVTPWIAQGWTVILDVDSQGYRSIKKRMPATGVFLMPPSLSDLDARLRRRATETDARRDQRLVSAASECAAAKEYDHVIVNDDVDRAVKTFEEIIGLRPVPTTGEDRRAK